MKIPSKNSVLKACGRLGVRLTVASMIAVVLATGINPSDVRALSTDQQRLFNDHILRFNWNDSVCGAGGALGGTGPGSTGGGGPGIWNSGLQPPYILEQFAIETLKAIASKRGVPQSATVTEQH